MGDDEIYLQPGFRFYPTEEELVSFYLKNKLEGLRVEEINMVIPVLDIYHYNPWELPKYAGKYSRKDPEEWFYFIPMQEKESRGGRPNRQTNEGYWKATGSPGYVYSLKNNKIIGGKRTMVFYNGRAPYGKKTPWKMNEYKSIDYTAPQLPPKLRQEMSICRVYVKSKSVRAFDRRPPPPPSSMPIHDPPLILPSAAAAAAAGSQLSSSPGDDSANNVENNYGMINCWSFADDDDDNTQPMWDWKLLN